MSEPVTAESLRWIQDLMRFDTTSRNSNLELVEFVADDLRLNGLDPIILPGADGTKANLLATVPSRDGRTTGGVVLSGHTDVVPVDGQNWQSSPFEPQIRDGRIYGRGACDMKGFLGVVMSSVPKLVDANLDEPIHLAFSYDEEVGMGGGSELVDEIVKRAIAPRICIVGEPTDMNVVIGHKSLNLFRIDFRGVSVHSSLAPRGVNAVEWAAEAVVHLRAIAAELMEDARLDEAYEIPFSTLSINMLHGGIAVNTVPDECSIEFDFRTVDGVSASEIRDRIAGELARMSQSRRTNSDGGLSIDLVERAMVPGLETNISSPAVSFLESRGLVSEGVKVTFGTEAGMFQRAGIETVVCGPGSIHQAHAPDEFIELEQIAYCEHFISSLLNTADLPA